MATFTSLSALSPESEQLLLITRPDLRIQLLHARLVNETCAKCIIQRGEQVYLSLRNIADEAQRQEVTWAVLRLQLGARLNPEEVPEPLRTVLLVGNSRPPPLLAALIMGGLSGVIGGVMTMAIVGLVITVLSIPPESYVGLAATAVSFVFSGAVIGVAATVYFWRRLTRKTAVNPTRSTIAKKTR